MIGRIGVGIGLIELGIRLIEIGIGLIELGRGLIELGIGLIELGIRLIELGISLRINNVWRNVLARVSGQAYTSFHLNAYFACYDKMKFLHCLQFLICSLKDKTFFFLFLCFVFCSWGEA